MIKIRKITIDKIIWSIFVFILIFSPPIIPYIHLVLAIISCAIIFLKYKRTLANVFESSGVNLWIKSFTFILFYLFIIPLPVSMILNDIVNIKHYVSLFNRFTVLIVTVIPCCTLLLCNIKKKQYDYHFFLEILVGAGIIEGVCAIFAFINPNIKNLFVSLMRQNTGSVLYSNTWYITIRSYGFAGTLVDLFGLGVAIIAGISFFYGITEKRRYIFYSIVVVCATILNARTGVLIYVIAVVITLVYLVYSKEWKMSIKAICGIAFLCVAFIGIMKVVSTNSGTQQWLMRGFENIVEFFENDAVVKKDTPLSKLFTTDFWELPGTFRTFIGTGHSKFLAGSLSHSDVGYINDIWFVGILGCIVLYGTLICLAMNVYRNSNNVVLKFSVLYILIAFAIFNIKGAAIGYNPGGSAIFTCLLVMNYFSKEK